MCIVWHLANPTTISVACGGEVGPSDAAQEGCMQTTALNQLPGGTYGHGTCWRDLLTHITEASLVPSLRYVNKVSFHPDSVVFSW